VFRLRLIRVAGEPGIRVRKKERKQIQIEWGERVQADGTSAKVYRLINQLGDQYVEKVVRSDGTGLERDEALSEHRGHGSARTELGGPKSQRRRRWEPI
jgi:hypothetical protein